MPHDQTVTTKLSPENLDFLSNQRRSLRPYDISLSSLVNLCVRIVRRLYARGELSLEPLQLQAQLTVDLGRIIESKRHRRAPTKYARHPRKRFHRA